MAATLNAPAVHMTPVIHCFPWRVADARPSRASAAAPGALSSEHRQLTTQGSLAACADVLTWLRPWNPQEAALDVTATTAKGCGSLY